MHPTRAKLHPMYNTRKSINQKQTQVLNTPYRRIAGRSLGEPAIAFGNQRHPRLRVQQYITVYILHTGTPNEKKKKTRSLSLSLSPCLSHSWRRAVYYTILYSREPAPCTRSNCLFVQHYLRQKSRGLWPIVLPRAGRGGKRGFLRKRRLES